MVIDDKLFRIYEEAHAGTYKNRADLARAVAAKKLNEFAYERNGERHYLTWGTIVEYVQLLVEYGLLGQDLSPTIKADRVSRRGFDLTLGEKVEIYAANSGFSIDRVREAVRTLIQRAPAQLPTPPSVFGFLQLPLNYSHFSRALSVRAYQTRANIHPKQKSVIIISDILRE